MSKGAANKYWYFFFPLLCILFAAGVFINGIEPEAITYSTERNYIFTSPAVVQIIVCAVSVLFFAASGVVFGIKKEYGAVIVFELLMIAFKLVIFISGLLDDSVSNLLWAIFCAPVSAIAEDLDIFVWVFYQAVLFLSFVPTLIFNRFRSKE